MRRLPALLALVLVPAAAAAQTPVTPTSSAPPAGPRTAADSLYLRAQRMVMNGAGTDGRAIVDSLLKAARPGSADYATALFWRAALAETAAEAERDYLRLTIEYPLSTHTSDALYRLGQLELTRGNRQLALSRFERLTADFPDSPQRPRALLGMGKIYLETRRQPQGCAAVAEAQQTARPQDVEVRNQATFLLRQCVGVNTTDARVGQGTTPSAAAAPTTAAVEPAPAEPTEPVEAPATAPTRTTERAGESARGTPATPARTATAPTTTTPRPAASTPKPAPAKPAAPAPAARPSRPGFAVQVAAFGDVAQARALVATLREQGVDARVDRDGTWHKVRAGHFATRAEASAHAKRLEAKGVRGFVTGVGGR
jgi:cell division septation protein DedD